MFAKKELKLHGGIIISGSHNPPEWNALKLLSENSFICDNELDEIRRIYKKIKINQLKLKSRNKRKVKKYNAIKAYIKDLNQVIDFKKVRKNNI
ncbi:MAG: hypothetical protein P8Y70_18875 [Candidatus Lokiarchaeota archaeon]